MLDRCKLAISVAVMSLLFAWFSSFSAAAHGWYEFSCCHDRDCGPALSIQRIPGVGLLVTSAKGTVLVPNGFQMRESKDGKAHICMQMENGEMKPICMYTPPNV